MARQSAAALEIAPYAQVEVAERIQPPSSLSKEQKREWRRVVDDMPADWFTRSNVQGLAQYCRHVDMAKRIAGMIEQVMSGKLEDKDGTRLRDLCKLQAAESRMINLLMTSMRMTPQSIHPTRIAPKQLLQRKTVNPWKLK